MIVLAIDPGNVQSAFVIWDSEEERICDMDIRENNVLLQFIYDWNWDNKIDANVIEMVASMGMPVGETVFETVFWIGRFYQVNSSKATRVYRKEIKMHFCNSMRAKDSNIRQALIDRFGKPGTKKRPGKLYRVKKDIWQALAVAVYYCDSLKSSEDRARINKNKK